MANPQGKNKRSLPKHKADELGVILNLAAAPEDALRYILVHYSGDDDIWHYYEVRDGETSWGYFSCLLILSVLAHRRQKGAFPGTSQTAEDTYAPAELASSDQTYGTLVRHYYLRRDLSKPYTGLDKRLREGVQDLFPAPSEGGRKARIQLSVAGNRRGTFHFWTHKEALCKKLSSVCGTTTLGNPSPPNSPGVEEHLGRLIREVNGILNCRHPPGSTRGRRLGSSRVENQGSSDGCVAGSRTKHRAGPRQADRAELASAPPGLATHQISFEAFIEDRLREFQEGSREYVFAALDAFVNDGDEPSGYFWITGDPGVGKSSILAKLVKDNKAGAHHFNIASEAIASRRQFLGNICAQLIVRCGLGYDGLPDGFDESSAFLNKLLRQAVGVRDEKLIVAVDALDEVRHDTQHDLRNPLCLPLALPRGVYFVVTSRRTQDGPVPASCIRPFELGEYKEANRRDVITYVRSYLPRNGVKKWMAKQRISAAGFVNLMSQRSDGNFMYLRHVLPAIEKGGFTTGRADDLPQGLRAYYRAHWAQMRSLDREAFRRVYERVVCVLAAAERPVSAEAVARWTDVPVAEVRRALCQWSAFLRKDGVGTRNPTYRIYHKAFQDFLQEEIDVDLRRYHRMIADSMLARVRRRRRR
ncbi:MAG TPA: ATP-binding protein [Phycisphaerae bacterium]|nr:ATP-binding protein [Phycisphaerae bacterium]HRY71472.1 ATP-binding protein [Phycisphaerae bacterium]HSA30013.1 ATP-binding protein [Phycisphaerae bacterium]